MPSLRDRRFRAVLNGLAAAVAMLLAGAPDLAAARLLKPKVDSDEYRRSWGLTAIGAQAAFDAGWSGRGVTVAMVDCGLWHAQRELMRNVSANSTDVVLEKRRQPHLDQHASFVAGPLASALNGRGMVGVAYNATILSIRADVDGGLNGQCAFRTSDLARALDYAVQQHARIVMLPLQSEKPLGARFEAALERLRASGAVAVIAAGNQNRDQPSWPARYAEDPRFVGSVIVAGATSYYGVMTPWSNRAGASKRHFIAAPGEWILTDCTKLCKLRSGTSFAIPYVAGALALLFEAHPQLSGPEGIERVLTAARDAGDPGPDDVYGRGVLDLARLFGSD